MKVFKITDYQSDWQKTMPHRNFLKNGIKKILTHLSLQFGK